MEWLRLRRSLPTHRESSSTTSGSIPIDNFLKTINMSNYDDLDIYNGDPEHDMWVDSDYQENTVGDTDIS